MKKIMTMILLTCAACLSHGEEVAVETVTSRGIGPTYRAAVNEALISALERKCGVTFNTSERTQIASSETSVSTAAGEVDRVALNDAITKNMQKWTHGKILGYEVFTDDYDPIKKQFTVELAARVPGRYIVGLDPNNRRRMAVVPFRVATGDSFFWGGQADSAVAWSQALADKISEQLTLTRKFTMLDRKYDHEVNAELARLSGSNAAKADTVRLNQKLGTDYLMVGEIKFFPVTVPGTNPLTGQALPVTSQIFAEITYRVLLAPTGQVKYSNTVKIDARECWDSTIALFASRSAQMAAVLISDETKGAILPFEIVGRTKRGLVVIGEGGKSLIEGETLDAYELGDEMTDTRTNEFIEQIEDKVGRIKVVRVTEKLSYGEIVEGKSEAFVAGVRLRRVPTQAPAPVAPPVTTTIKSNGGTGVVVPF